MSEFPWSICWLCLTALVAGAVNSVAGGGTLLTFPALVAALSPLGSAEAAIAANATSTVALLPGSIAGAWGYRRVMKESRRWMLLLIGPSLLGGAIGSLLVTRLDPQYFADLVPWLLLAAAVLFLIDTCRGRSRAAGVPPRPHANWAIGGLLILQFVVAIYGGYFGAAVGILMLSVLPLMGVGNIHQMNAVKTVLGSCINGISVVVFIEEGKVSWGYAVPMAAAAVLGGYLGARFALLISPRAVRWIVVAIGFGLAGYFFWKN